MPDSLESLFIGDSNSDRVDVYKWSLLMYDHEEMHASCLHSYQAAADLYLTSPNLNEAYMKLYDESSQRAIMTALIV